MSYAVVSTKRSSLKVYTTTNSAAKNQIGLIPTGTTVETLDYRLVNNVEWLKVKSNEISGWVILKHPSVSYYYLENLGAKALANNTAVYYAGTSSWLGTDDSVGNIITAENDGKKRETYGVVTNIQEGTKSSTVEITQELSKSVTDFSFPGTKMYGTPNDASVQPPQMVQNSKGYPTMVRYDTNLKRFIYDYSTDYSSNEFIAAINEVKNSVNLHQESSAQLYDRYSRYYNRFKVATVDDVLTKTFAHVFFTRPDCNIVQYNGNNNYTLLNQVANKPDYLLEYKNNIETLLQLVQTTGAEHQFMMLPSNRVTSFECKDRSIKSDTYGKTFHGNSIAYGRHIDDSTAASEVSISFTDDRDLHLLRMHQMWVEYISDVNKGILRPNDNYLFSRCLDYACSAYYIVCAENGEDIIYWSKLYGVFPTSIPDSIMSWNKSQVITNPEISITYQYSWKADWKAETITEFNLNSSGSLEYLRTYNPDILSTGSTWVGAPFIEMVKDGLGRTVYKLRFRKV